MLDLYNNIKKNRLERNWTQSDLAIKMGYSDKSMIAKIENGKVDLPQSKIIQFAEVFGCKAGDLMGWSDEVIHSDLQDEILLYCTKLNDLGISKLLERAEELSLLDKYRRM